MHEIEKDLDSEAVSEWFADDIAELELLLSRHAAFEAWLRERDFSQPL